MYLPRSVARAGWSALINTSSWFSAAIITSLVTPVRQCLYMESEYGMDISGVLMTLPCRDGAALQIESFVVRMFSQHRLETLASVSTFVWRGVMLPYGGLALVNSPPLPWHILRAKQNLCPTSPAASHSLLWTVPSLWLAWTANPGVSLVTLKQMPFKQETHVMEN